MGFWETAAAALVGGLGVLFLAGLCRLGWLVFKMRFTAYGRLVQRTGIDIEKALKEAERRGRGR